MLSHLGAKLAAVATARGRRTKLNVLSRAVAAIVAGASLTGCMADSRPVAAAGHPADPSAPSARVGYRSTIAPYSRLRPATPLAWRERNERVTPPSKSDQ